MVRWINFNQNNKSVLAHQYSVLAHQYSVLWEKTGLTAGRQVGRQNMGRSRNIQNFLQVKLFGLLFCLILLQCYYCIRTAFQQAFVK